MLPFMQVTAIKEQKFGFQILYDHLIFVGLDLWKSIHLLLLDILYMIYCHSQVSNYLLMLFSFAVYSIEAFIVV